MNHIAENLLAVKARMTAAAEQAERAAGDITLVAISKTKSADLIRTAIVAGQRVFGENRVQEAETKWPAIKVDHADLILHLVGPLQRNKVRKAVALFDVIESVDRERIARALAEEMDRTGFRPECFIQVNTGEEPQKAGILPADVDRFIRLCREELRLPVTGLMCIPPVDEAPALHFGLLAGMAERNGLKRLSMGMSDDFEVGIRFGATHVRVGTAIFGERPTLT